ncbi:MAG: hypothetical protein FIA99_19135 [Ruminiclostridium sp.]|nr:hypothetical protein [Ruminiclostridium sp.]
MMLKYRGQYRVILETDKKTGKPLEFTFIPCRIYKGANICRYSGTMLNAYLPSIKVFNRLLKEHPELFTAFQTGSSEGTLLFKESDMEEAAIILKAYTLGKNISPRSRTRNARFV